MYPTELRYTVEHEWVRTLNDDRAIVGITMYAQEQLGDVVFVELPKAGDRIEATQSFGVVESVKTASDLFAPVSGTVVDVNTELEQNPDYVNTDPYGDGWLIVIKPDNAADIDNLLTAQQYTDQIAGS